MMLLALRSAWPKVAHLRQIPPTAQWMSRRHGRKDFQSPDLPTPACVDPVPQGEQRGPGARVRDARLLDASSVYQIDAPSWHIKPGTPVPVRPP
jgi:hypothetical protein